MTFLEGLIRKWLPTSRVEVRIDPASDAREVRVRYSDHDWHYYATDHVNAVSAARELIPQKRTRRRLHWGRDRRPQLRGRR